MTRSFPTVSVVIPFYSDDQCLPGALGSVASQTLAVHEVVVVDDASPPGTSESLRALPPGVRAMRLEHNSGPGRARQVGTEATTGELVSYLDSDDRWPPDFLDRCVQLLMDHPEAPAVFTGIVKCYPDGQRLEYRDKPDPLDVREAIVRFHAYPGQAMLFRRSALIAVGGWNTARHVVDDWELVVRLLDRFGPIPLVPGPLVEYRVHHEGGRLNSQGWRKLRRWYHTVRSNRELLQRHYGKGAARRRFAQAVRDRADHRGGLEGGGYRIASRLIGRPLDLELPVDLAP